MKVKNKFFNILCFSLFSFAICTGIMIPTKSLVAEGNQLNEKTFNKEFFKIVGLVTATAIAYGITLDQITARMCEEYFNSNAVPHHKELLDALGLTNASPTTIAFVFGITATWWVGLPLGLLVATTSLLGKKLKLNAKKLIKPLFNLFSFMGVTSAAAWLCGYFVTPKEDFLFNGYVLDGDKAPYFMANASAHEMSYISGIVGGIGLSLWTIYKRITNNPH
jgi:hypothetical protein